MKYFFTLLISLAVIAASAQAKLTIDSTLHDFGTMKEGEKVTYKFVVKNTGTTPLYIINVTQPCGCTIPSFSQEPIEPGKTAEITVQYDSEGHPGIFAKQLQIQSNDPEKYHTITITGTVIAKPTTETPKKLPVPAGRADD